MNCLSGFAEILPPRKKDGGKGGARKKEFLLASGSICRPEEIGHFNVEDAGRPYIPLE